MTEEEWKEIYKDIDGMIAIRNFFNVLLSSQKGSRMFSIVGETWNPVTGCPHNCIYCWARKLAMTKLRNSERYKEGFRSKLNPEEFKRSFSGGVVFVSDMGDLFAETVPDEWIRRVLEHIKKFPSTFFLFLTKNPRRYHDFVDEFPQNSILGATVETDDDSIYRGISGAPLPTERIEAMIELNWKFKFISIEPILKFTDDFSEKIREIKPFMVYVGYDNYDNRLPEPTLEETNRLIEALMNHTLVIRKTIRPAWYEGIERYIQAENGGYGNRRGNYKKFEENLSYLRENALNFLSEMDSLDQKAVRNILSKVYPGHKERYWSIKKLYALAMFLPVFLQIGLTYKKKGRFDKIVYIDTHSGPGWAKVGPSEDEILPGSPLIALLWPTIVSERLKQFSKIKEGFDEYILIERDKETYEVLRRTVEKVRRSNNVVINFGDCNNILKSIIDHYNNLGERVLILLFVDPFGDFESQLLSETLSKILTSKCKVDFVMNIMSTSLARGLTGLLKERYNEYKWWVRKLFGECDEGPVLCKYCKEKPGDEVGVRREDVLEAYRHIFKRHDYSAIYLIPVEFREENVLYDLLFASRSPGAENWLGKGYINYIKENIPKSYEEIKGMWFKVTGRGLEKHLA
jgi:three-Cys-motif partner protein